ncbi:hypothetical protein [Candidatus Pyrohabitans sp.]
MWIIGRIIAPILRIFLFIILAILVFKIVKNKIKNIIENVKNKNNGTLIISARGFPEEIQIGPFSEAKLWYHKIKQRTPEIPKRNKLIIGKIASFKTKISKKLKSLRSKDFQNSNPKT